MQPSATPQPLEIGAMHRRRLRALWRSSGWPSQDLVEAELLAAGLLERRTDERGRDTVRVTDEGVKVIADAVRQNRQARDAHELLVERVAIEMQRSGRIVWRGLSLRAPLLSDAGATSWAVVMPDVFSVRNTTVEDYVEPIVHEVKVRRADLLGDLRKPAKREAYRALSSQCWYVLKAGIGMPDEIPTEYGVLLAHGHALEVARPAAKRPTRLPFGTWMALARANAQAMLDDDSQAAL